MTCEDRNITKGEHFEYCVNELSCANFDAAQLFWQDKVNWSCDAEMIVLEQAAQQGLVERHGIDKDDILCDYVGADVFVWTTLCLSMCSWACTQHTVFIKMIEGVGKQIF